MPVTEFVAFRLKAPYTLNDKDTRSNFQTLSSWQSDWSKYPLTFYNAVDDPAIVYLVSGWKDVEDHMKWIGSERNQSLIKIFEPILSIIDFAHVEVDFRLIPSDTGMLVYRKDTANDEQEISTEGIDIQTKEVELWSGQGKVIDGEGVYHFKALKNLESLSSAEHPWKIIRRIYL